MGSKLTSLGFFVAWFGMLPHATAAIAGKYNITGYEKAVCIGDATRFCASAYPDEDKLLDCMRSNRDALSRICRIAFDAGLKRRRL